MSHSVVSQPQFHEQLRMFMPTEEIVNSVHKGDTSLGRGSSRRNRPTPLAQWTDPKSGAGGSLRDEKLWDLKNNDKYRNRFDKHPSWLTAPPVEIYHDSTGPILVEGHHRLAKAEHEGIPYMAVTNSLPRRWEDW